ncbi:MAG: hypothetical protein AAGA30_08465, partial [Planctomycetota bacterium]
MRKLFKSLAAILLFAVSPLAMAQVQPTAGMMRFPDISDEKIVFCYADDLWVVDREGGVASPLASPKGAERFPRFSPDGKSIAFMGNYDGGTDIYTIGIGGGIAERITYHPSGELLCDWTPNGKALIFSSNGYAGLNRQLQLFTISSTEPLAKKLPVPYGSNGAISPDAKWLAYTPHSRDNRTWKRYQGGMASDIWLFNLEDKTSKQMTDFAGTDSIPMWHGTTVYYLSDAGKEHRLNIWAFDTKSGERKQVTKFSDDDVKWPSVGPGKNGEGEIIFSAGPEMYVLNLESGESKSVSVTVPGDRPNLRRKKVDASKFVNAADISPTGKRVTVEARGDIWTAPAKNGSPRNLTKSSGSAERFPSWSPDGKWIAYLSDATGEYEMMITQSDGRGETKQLTKDGSCYRYPAEWSPDSKHMVFADKTGALHLLTVESGETKLIDTDPYAQQINPSWSHDSKWLCYAKATDTRAPSSHIWTYNVEDGSRRQLTTGFFQDVSPTFDRKGEYIYFASNRVFNSPKYEDIGTTFIYSGTQVLLAMPLREDIEYPLLPKSDEETWKDEDDDKEKDKSEDTDDEKNDGKDQEDADSDTDEEDDQSEEESDDQQETAKAPADPVSGYWDIELKSDLIPEGERNASMTLELADDGKTVTGTVQTPMGEKTISSGTFDKSSGELSLTIDVEGETITVSGTIADGVFSGSVDIQGRTFDLEATRSGNSSDSSEDEDGKEDDDDDEEKEDSDDESSDKKKGKGKKKKKKDPLKIDFDGIERRAFQLPIGAGNFGSLVVNDKNHLIFATRPSRGGDGTSAIKIFDIKDEKKAAKTVVSGTANFDISADGKKLIVMQGDKGYVINATAGQKLSDAVSRRGMNVMIDPREEWKQI